MAVHSSSRHMKKLKADFFQQGKADDAPCWLCGMPIDYETAPGSTDDSHELDHYYPVSTHPELQEDPANFRHAHSSCNRARSNNMPNGELGQLSRAWW